MKNKSHAFLSFIVIFTLLLGIWEQTAQALVIQENTGNGYTEYLGLTGVFSERNAPFRMVVPDNWNKKLLIYARGTGSAILLQKTDDDELIPIFDSSSGLPMVGVTPLTNVPGYPSGDNILTQELESRLLEKGYALAASDYKPDERFVEKGLLSWVVEDGIQDTLALTFQACATLMLRHGQYPNRTILWGRSQGSIIALKILEKHPRLYDGVITGSTVGAGTSRTWDTAIDFALAYDAAFGWPDDKWGRLGDVHDDITFNVDVLPVLVPQLKDSNFGRFEFIRLVNGLPSEGFYPDPDQGFQNFNWLFTDMLFITEVRADLERKAEGAIGQNIDHVYSLDDSDREYLQNLNVDTDKLLKYMNRKKFKADDEASEYLKKFADFSGEISRPVISMHTTVDGLVVPAHESAYLKTVKEAGNDDLLLQVFTDAVGHCTFTPEQWLKTIDVMELWLDEDKKPDESIFPNTSGFIGFTELYESAEISDWQQPPPQ